MIITITSIRLRKLLGYFPLTYTALGVVRQIRKQPGFIRMRNTGFGYLHYTISAWESESAAKVFAHSGAHAAAMRKAAGLATEIRILTYAADALPAWSEAKLRLAAEGRSIAYSHRA
jgi:heme-degrading monooxygenase HmoA